MLIPHLPLPSVMVTIFTHKPNHLKFLSNVPIQSKNISYDTHTTPKKKHMNHISIRSHHPSMPSPRQPLPFSFILCISCVESILVTYYSSDEHAHPSTYLQFIHRHTVLSLENEIQFYDRCLAYVHHHTMRRQQRECSSA